MGLFDIIEADIIIEMEIENDLFNIINESFNLILNEDGGRELCKFYTSDGTVVCVQISSLDKAGRAGNASQHGPRFKVKRIKDKNFGDGIPILLPEKNGEKAKIDPDVSIKDKRIINNYDEIIDFGTKNGRVLRKIWNDVNDHSKYEKDMNTLERRNQDIGFERSKNE